MRLTKTRRTGRRSALDNRRLTELILKPVRGMKSSSASNEPSVSLSKQIAAFISKCDPRVGKVFRRCRAELRKLLPAATELVYDNYNFFVIGYASTERTSDTI